MATPSGDAAAKPPSVYVFWDYENEPIRRQHNPVDVVALMKSALLGHGRVVGITAYSAQTISHLKSLQYAGIIVRAVPPGKEAVDKTIIVDMLLQAREREPETTVFALVTGDRDYCYCMSRLSQLGFTVVLMSSHGLPPELEASAAKVYSVPALLENNAARLQAQPAPASDQQPQQGSAVAAVHASASADAGGSAVAAFVPASAAPAAAAASSAASFDEDDAECAFFLPDLSSVASDNESVAGSDIGDVIHQIADAVENVLASVPGWVPIQVLGQRIRAKYPNLSTQGRLRVAVEMLAQYGVVEQRGTYPTVQVRRAGANAGDQPASSSAAASEPELDGDVAVTMLAERLALALPAGGAWANNALVAERLGGGRRFLAARRLALQQGLIEERTVQTTLELRRTARADALIANRALRM